MISKEDKIKALAFLAQDAEVGQEIDWAELPMNKDEAFLMMASNVVEQIDSLNEKERITVSMATIVKLLVDNFVLNLKLKSEQTDV